MKLSSKTHYGLMACNILAENFGKDPVPASELENRISVSGKYLEKIMRMLSAHGIVSASRGANGGYFLSLSPDKIKIGDIVRSLENVEIIGCVTKSGTCKHCPSSRVWKKLYNGINELLDSVTLQQMLDGSV